MDGKAQEIIRGTVLAVLFQNQENGYTVIRFTTEEQITITVVGTIPLCTPGEKLVITGHWETHQTHGMQFHAEFLERVMPAGAQAIEQYLSSRVIKGIGPRTASRIVKLFGDETFEVMEQDPERLAEVPGISPQKARAIGVSFQKQFGMRKLLEFLLKGGLPGELAMPLYKAYGDLAMEALHDDPYLLTEDFFGASFAVVDQFAVRNGVEAEDPRRVQSAAVQREIGTEYAPDQREAILKAARSTVMLLTGGPGTGKTTTVNGILGLFDRLGIKTVLAAPTGRAANRMKELCGREAATIHRLLETQYDPESGNLCFMHDESEPLKADAVVVDETSMVDILLMAALLKALKPHCRLILVGDPDQLPSVGAGNLFSDLIRSGKVPTVRLTEIFRQARESLIIMNAHAINAGQLPELTVKNKDFFFLQRRDMQRAVDTIVDLCTRRLPQNMGIPADQIQVLSPTRKTDAGTAALNMRLQAALNPPSADKQEHKRGKILFRVGDRVMQIKNNYDIMWKKTEGFGVGTGVFNGDVGKVTDIDPGEETMTVVFDDRQVEYTFDLLGQLELAYAMTVHKSQGSEYRAVILSVSQANPYLLTRSILYTAVTRAKELLILVGDPAVVQQMVENNRQSRRYSGLKLRLEKDG